MKKIIAFVSAIIFLSVTPLMAVIGPIPVDESNDLPDGQIYGWVTITQIDVSCVEIKADANQDILIPGPNFGIQAFGFNYAGDTSCLDVTVPSGWVESTGIIDGFGVFIERVDTTGSYRQDPLVIQVCNMCGALTEAEVVVANALGYTFAMHIADFSGNECFEDPEDCSSAFFATKKTTVIELSSFSAKGKRLTWVTLSEVDNVGFNIWRATAKDGIYEKVNDEIIPSQGSATEGAIYTFIDKAAKKGGRYFYKLEDIDIYGNSTFHGPITAKTRILPVNF